MHKILEIEHSNIKKYVHKLYSIIHCHTDKDLDINHIILCVDEHMYQFESSERLC